MRGWYVGGRGGGTALAAPAAARAHQPQEWGEYTFYFTNSFVVLHNCDVGYVLKSIYNIYLNSYNWRPKSI